MGTENIKIFLSSISIFLQKNELDKDKDMISIAMAKDEMKDKQRNPIYCLGGITFRLPRSRSLLNITIKLIKISSWKPRLQ